MIPTPWQDQVRFDPSGLVPVVAQDARTGGVLMLAWANADALESTLRTGQAHYFSRSRNALWHKGSTSGNVQHLVEMRLDCDGDSILYRVHPEGPSCHTGAASCFMTVVTNGEAAPCTVPPAGHTLERLSQTITDRARTAPEGSWTATLLSGGPPLAARKTGEEAVEVMVAALTESSERLESEAADLLYHLLVLLQTRDVTLSRVYAALDSRMT
jgi:phosphoribosyl-ATP pyrophosphohydrolase/phosphoribosyl-AMP cyclohydrolase